MTRADLEARIAATRAQARRDLVLVEAAIARTRTTGQLVTLLRLADALRARVGGD